MNTALAHSYAENLNGLGCGNPGFERKVYLTDLILDRTFSGLLNYCIESGNGDLHIAMTEVSVYEYSSCIPLYSVSNLDLSRAKDMIFIEEAA